MRGSPTLATIKASNIKWSWMRKPRRFSRLASSLSARIVSRQHRGRSYRQPEFRFGRVTFPVSSAYYERTSRRIDHLRLRTRHTIDWYAHNDRSGDGDTGVQVRSSRDTLIHTNTVTHRLRHGRVS